MTYEFSTISFDDLVKGRDATVRVTPDKFLYAVDLVMVMTNKDRDQAAMVLRRLSEKVFSSSKFIERRTSSHGGYKTKLLGFKDAINLIMVLPGKFAREARKQFANIIHRYLAGDASLLEEIQSNSNSISAISQLARETFGQPMQKQIQDPQTRKRQLEDIEK